MKRLAVSFIIMLLGICALHAADEQIVFAVPDTGRITLGVFDNAGKLVRTLHSLDGEEAFRIGLNGYMTSWNGLDDEGNKLPAGHYHIRGFLVGDIKVEGEAIHFNDWINDDESPRLKRIQDFCLLPSGDVVVLAENASGTLVCFRYSATAGFQWEREIGPISENTLLATNANSAIIFQSGSWHVLSLASGEPVSKTDGNATATAIAAKSDAILSASATALTSFALPSFQPKSTSETPTGIISLDAGAKRLVAASAEALWTSQANQTFEKIPLPVNGKSLALGTGDTFWFIGSSPSDNNEMVIAQADFSGTVLRTWHQEKGAPEPRKIRASQEKDIFAVLESTPQMQRLRVLSRTSTGEWTIDWQKSIQQSADFGFLNNEVAPSVKGTPPPQILKVRLIPNPLTGERQQLALKAVADKSGTRFVSPDGLPLINISDDENITRMVMQRGKTGDSVRFLQGDGAAVEEFTITGLNRIIPLNAGGVDLR